MKKNTFIFIVTPIILLSVLIIILYFIPINLHKIDGNFYASKLQMYYKLDGVSGNDDKFIPLKIFPWNFRLIKSDYTFYTNKKSLFKIHFYDGPTPTVIKLEGDYTLDKLEVVDNNTVRDNNNIYIIKSKESKTRQGTYRMEFYLEKL